MTCEMCIPCAAKLAETKEIKMIIHRGQKVTCSECGRRRYGAEYEVGPKAEPEK